MDDLITVAASRQVALPDLSGRINEAHHACTEAMNAGLQHAIEAGKLLIEAKSQCGHGKWLPWLAERCPDISTRTAQLYMRVARSESTLTDSAKAQRVAHMSLRRGAKLLAEPKHAPMTIELAEKFDVDPHDIERASRVLRADPDLAQRVLDGNVTLDDAEAVISDHLIIARQAIATD